MNLFSKLFRSRDKPTNHLGGLSFLFGQTAAGKAVNERTAMQTTTVYACVRILAESIAGLPLHVYKYKGQGKERVYLPHFRWIFYIFSFTLWSRRTGRLLLFLRVGLRVALEDDAH